MQSGKRIAGHRRLLKHAPPHPGTVEYWRRRIHRSSLDATETWQEKPGCALCL